MAWAFCIDPQDVPPLPLLVVLFGIPAGCIIGTLKVLVAVSYTHLLVVAVVGGVEVRGVGRELSSTGIDPVSYTHLDVYKRQPQFIRRLFNGGRFGPPWNFTSTST